MVRFIKKAKEKHMFTSIAKKIFGTANERIVKGLEKNIEAINALEPELKKLSDAELCAKTDEFKARIANNETLDQLLTEAFAVVREASVRALGMRHFDVQLLGAMVLHKGMITEMKTGEGKTLVATLAAYLNALEGKGVHVITVNDYLAKRDSAWMEKLYGFLGLSVGCITNELRDDARKAAYAADITYGTNNEFGFDYLRDNMKFTREQMVQREHHYAIVDEVDSILIDEARTPLIISGPAENSSELYVQANKLIPKLKKEDYEVDEKAKTASLTEDGNQHMELLLQESGMLEEGKNLYDFESLLLVHHVNQALKAHMLFEKDKDYIVKDGRVVIIDEFTGRMMDGRRYSEGLHQALEAKENVAIQNENQTLASITFQNYFRMYHKLAGMTGTAMTEASEFSDIYKLEVVEIPTHRNIARVDEDDDIYRTAEEKYQAIISEIAAVHKKGQPILVGTVSIENSELVSSLLKKNKITHHVLNAKHHAQEASIISQAGRLGAVTIATNMAGRGTDIMLGGNPEMLLAEELLKHPDASEKKKAELEEKIKKQVVEEKQAALEAGGLYVLGTERHESRRIDNQLRGRSGRQGDPGKTKFFLSLEDDLMRIFGSERIGGMLQKLGLKEGEAITHPWISRAIEKAQKKVEAHHYDTRKNLLKFDDVMNDQRKVIFEQRIEVMEAQDISDLVAEMCEDVNEAMVQAHIPEKSYAEQWDVEGLQHEVMRTYGIELPIKKWASEEGIADLEITERLHQAVKAFFSDKEAHYGSEVIRLAEKRVVLLTLDQLWKDHLLSLDHLRQGINLRAYGQKDPLNEYKREAFNLFEAMLNHLRELVVTRLAYIEFAMDPESKQAVARMPVQPNQKMVESRQDPAMVNQPQGATAQGKVSPSLAPVRQRVSQDDRDPANPETWGRIGRNEACPCGSGKKYKQCHGKLQ